LVDLRVVVGKITEQQRTSTDLSTECDSRKATRYEGKGKGEEKGVVEGGKLHGG
jgi:hypothetical protein